MMFCLGQCLSSEATSRALRIIPLRRKNSGGDMRSLPRPTTRGQLNPGCNYWAGSALQVHPPNLGGQSRADGPGRYRLEPDSGLTLKSLRSWQGARWRNARSLSWKSPREGTWDVFAKKTEGRKPKRSDRSCVMTRVPKWGRESRTPDSYLGLPHLKNDVIQWG